MSRLIVAVDLVAALIIGAAIGYDHPRLLVAKLVLAAFLILVVTGVLLPRGSSWRSRSRR